MLFTEQLVMCELVPCKRVFVVMLICFLLFCFIFASASFFHFSESHPGSGGKHSLAIRDDSKNIPVKDNVISNTYNWRNKTVRLS